MAAHGSKTGGGVGTNQHAVKGRSVVAVDPGRVRGLGDDTVDGSDAGTVAANARVVFDEAGFDVDAAGRLWDARFAGCGVSWDEALDAMLDAEDTDSGADIEALLAREASRIRAMVDRLEAAGMSSADALDQVSTFNRITVGAMTSGALHGMSESDVDAVVGGLSAAVDPLTADRSVVAAAQWTAEQHGSLAAAARVCDGPVQDVVARFAPGAAWVGLDTYCPVVAEIDFPDGSGSTRRTVSGVLRGHAPAGEPRRLTSDRGFEVFASAEQVVSLRVVRDRRMEG